MTAKKLHLYLMIVFFASVLGSIYLVRYAANWLTSSSTELSTLRQEVTVLEKNWTNLEKAKKLLADRKTEVETLSYVLPEEKDQARVVKEIYAIADQANVAIDSVGFPSSTLGSVTKKPAPTTNQDGASSEAPKNTAVSQATPLKNIPGVQEIELSIGSITSKDPLVTRGIRYEEMDRLLRLIERNRRLMQIKSIGIGQVQNPGGLSTYELTLSIVIYIQP